MRNIPDNNPDRREELEQQSSPVAILHGGMYVYANISSTGMDAETFCYELLRQEQVMIFPGTMFADPGNQHVRITLLSPMESVREALERMARFVGRS